MPAEWRVFIPLNPSSGADDCVRSCQEVIESFVPSSHPQESRSDEYIITCEEFGLKYRNGEKLELKVRTHHNQDYGIECFSKVKFGKKKLTSKQTENIFAVLQEHGHSQTQHYTNMLIDPKSIVISKSRRSNYDEISGMAIEVCYIIVQEVRGTELTVPREWISLSLESHDPALIEQYLTSNSLGTHLTRSLRNLVESGQITPCVIGYPGWIKHLSNWCAVNALSVPAVFR
jgi:hypothetical protein